MEESFSFQYSLLEYIISLLGLVASLVDIGLDVWNVVSFYQEGEYVYMAVVIVLLLGSSVLVQMFSWFWYSDSEEQIQTHTEKYLSKHNLLKPLHVLQLGVFVRYSGFVEISTHKFLQQTDLVSEGVASYLSHDLSFLRLIEAFSENASQVTLMMSIIAIRQELQLFTGFKTLVAVSGIALSVVMYHRNMREFRPGKRKMSWTSSGVYFLWNLFFILARVTALALFISVLPCYIIAHFLSMWMLLVWGVYMQKTDFMENSRRECLYRFVVGIIWYFSWFNIRDGSTKFTSIVYYTFLGLDTMMLLAVWFWKIHNGCIWTLSKPHIVIPVLAGLYVLGIIFIIIYYKKLHPNCDKTKVGLNRLYDTATPMRAPAMCGISVEAESAEDVLQRFTGAQRRMRIMAANFYY